MKFYSDERRGSSTSAVNDAIGGSFHECDDGIVLHADL
jgi:hypothetical protein